MVRQKPPDSNELEFIYKCFVKGYSDQEVLEKMLDRVEFPVRNLHFILQRRNEYEAARVALGLGTSQEVDPGMIRAKERHFREVYYLIEKWKGMLSRCVPLIMDKGIFDIDKSGLPDYFTAITSDTIFSCLVKHIPSDTLWSAHSFLERILPKYIQRLDRLTDNIRRQGTAWTNDHTITSDFEKPILNMITSHSVKLNVCNLSFRCFGNALEVCNEYRDGYKSCWITLEAEKPGLYIQAYRELCTSICDTPEVSEVVKEYNELSEKVRISQDLLEKVIVQRSYLAHTCNICHDESNILG
jgi:hypothetical protein